MHVLFLYEHVGIRNINVSTYRRWPTHNTTHHMQMSALAMKTHMYVKTYYLNELIICTTNLRGHSHSRKKSWQTRKENYIFIRMKFKSQHPHDEEKQTRRKTMTAERRWTGVDMNGYLEYLSYYKSPIASVLHLYLHKLWFSSNARTVGIVILWQVKYSNNRLTNFRIR